MKESFLLDSGTWSIGDKPDQKDYLGLSYVLENNTWSVEEEDVELVWAWASRPNTPISRYSSIGCGTVNSSLSAGGMPADSFDPNEEAHTYNGTSWSPTASALTELYYHQGCGTGTDAIMISGQDTARTEHYTGASWSTGGNTNSERKWGSASGTADAAIVSGGKNMGFNFLGTTEHYNGVSWSPGGDQITPRSYTAGCGTIDAAMNIAGFDASGFGGNDKKTDVVEHYNGASWSAAGLFPATAAYHSAVGTITSVLSFGVASGGMYDPPDRTYVYDGVSWSQGPNMLHEVMGPGTSGTSTSALSFEGTNDYVATDDCEEYGFGVI